MLSSKHPLAASSVLSGRAWAAQTPSVWQGVSGRAVFVIPGGLVLWEGSAVLWWYMGCLCPVLPHQLSVGAGALGRLCWLCSQRGS